MRGSAAFRSAVAPGGVLAGPWVKNALWRRALAVPSLDLRFAENKSLVNATTGQNLVTFTRASSGTYVDSQGVIRTATTNLLLRSEEFDNASWSKLRLQAFGSGSVVDAAASPIGTLTAEKITEDSTTGFHYVQPLNGSTVASGATITASIYAKASERIGIAVFPYSSAAGARFNLSLGTVHSVDAGVTASIQNVGNGWYRCIASITAPGTSATPWFLILNAAFGTSYAGDGTSGILVWGAQLEQSSTVGEYIPTTSAINSAPRFDHNPTTGESLGLLVEESRTNLLLQSEDFSTTWGTSTATVSTNVDTAPNGSLTADKLIVNSGASSGYAAQSNSYTSGTTYAFSVYAKAAGATDFRIVLLATSFGSSSTAQFNLSNGTVTSFSGAWSSVAISAVGNGWYRVSGIATATATASSASRFQCNATGDGSIGVLIWGAQLEAGAFPTSYIPTTTAAATRSADVASITGSNFGVSRTNYIRNNTMVGAVAGTPGTLPTNWSVASSVSGLSYQIVGTGTESGITYIDIKWTGTPSGNGTIQHTFESNTNTAATSGQNWTASAYCRLVGGAIPSTASLLVVERSSANAFLTSSSTSVTILNSSLISQRTAHARTLNNASTAYVNSRLDVSVTSGVAVDFTLRIGMPQLEQGAFATNVIPTSTAAVTVVESPWYRQDTQTWFGEYAPVYNASATVPASTLHLMQVYNLAVGTNNYAIRGANNSVNQEFIARNPTAGSQFPSNSGIGFGVAGTNRKVSFGIDSSTLNVSTNGAINSVANNAAALMATHDILSIGSGTGGSPPYALNGTIRRLTYWPQRLPNSTLQQITQ